MEKNTITNQADRITPEKVCELCGLKHWEPIRHLIAGNYYDKSLNCENCWVTCARQREDSANVNELSAAEHTRLNKNLPRVKWEKL